MESMDAHTAAKKENEKSMRTISVNSGYDYVSVETAVYDPLDTIWTERREQKATADVDVEAFLNDLFGMTQ